jgi:hypothetical protein
MRRLAAATAGLALVGVALPATASALSRAQADAIALRTLRPLAGKKNAILFGLPKPVRAGSRVFAADPARGRATGKVVRKKIARLRNATWLYWLDQVPYAMFSHPGTYLLVDDRTGRVVKRAKTRWYPTIDGKPPAFITRKGYDAKRYRVYSKLTRRRPAAAAPFFSFAWPLATVPPGALNGECVLIVSDWTDPLFQNNYDAFSSWSRSLKIPTFFSTGDGPVQTIPGRDAKPAGKDTLRDNASELIVKHNCTDIVLYITGHGMEAKDGPPTVVTRNEITMTELGYNQKTTGVTADDVYSAVGLHPGTGFKVKIDSCFSGRFLDDFAPRGADGKRETKLKNLLIMEVSSPANQVSLGASEVWDSDNPNSLGQFTNQNLTGLEKFFASQEEIGKAREEGGSLMARALDRAFDLGASVNEAIDEDGTPITPLKFTNFGPPAPKFNIRIVFDPSTFTTTYPATPKIDGLTYAWSVQFTADTECAKEFKPGSPQPHQATWAHLDKEQGGPCGHGPSQVGEKGHNGTVKVVATNDFWSCTATYIGTQGRGTTTGESDPAVCERR